MNEPAALNDWQEKIRFLQSKGITQQRIADFVGCSQSYIGLISTGSRGRNVSFWIAERINLMVSQVKNGTLPV